MGMLLAFTPFVLFVIIERLADVKAGLVSAALGAAALLAYNLLGRRKSAKALEVGTAVLFGALAAHACLSAAPWPVAGVRLCVDAGLLGVVLVSVALRRPFTLQYAREQVAPEFWDKPGFVRANYVITAAWALAFALMVSSDLTLFYAPRMPAYLGIVATVAAMVGAVRFTSWYPKRVTPK